MNPKRQNDWGVSPGVCATDIVASAGQIYELISFPNRYD